MWLVVLYLNIGCDFSSAKLFNDKQKAKIYANRMNKKYAKSIHCRVEDLEDTYKIYFIPIAKEGE